MTKTEKAIKIVGFVIWLHFYLGILSFFFWLSVIWKDGPGTLGGLRMELKLLWIIIISGAFFLYTLLMLWLKTWFDLLTAKMMIGVIKAYMKVESAKRELVQQLEKFKAGIDVTTVNGLRQGSSQGP
jgi:hypothetical protein